MTFTGNFTIKPKAPFSFGLTAGIFSEGDRQIRFYINGRFFQVIRINDKLVLANLLSKGTVDQPEICVEIKSNTALTTEDKKQAEQTINSLFSLNFALLPFYEQVKCDPVMATVTKTLLGLKNYTTPTVFEGLVYSIVEQQISLKVAYTIEARLTRKFGETLSFDDSKYFAFPTPKQLADASIQDIRQCGLSEKKAQYIWNASKLIVDGELDLEHLKNHKSAEQIIAELDEIRGIGVWTAELTMLRGMQKLDALPADDFGLKRVISKFYFNGKPIKSADAREIAERWGKWKGLAAYYLLLVDEKGINVEELSS